MIKLFNDLLKNNKKLKKSPENSTKNCLYLVKFYLIFISNQTSTKISFATSSIRKSCCLLICNS